MLLKLVSFEARGFISKKCMPNMKSVFQIVQNGQTDRQKVGLP